MVLLLDNKVFSVKLTLIEITEKCIFVTTLKNEDYMKKKRTEIVLEYSFWMKLKWIALSQGMTLAGLFRMILTNWMVEYEQTKTKTNTASADPSRAE